MHRREWMIYLTTRGGHSQPNVLMMEKIKILSFLFLISTAKHLFVNIRGYACSEAVLLLLCTGIVHSKLFCADHTEASVHLHSWRYFHLKNSNQDIQELFTLVLNSL